MPIKIASFHNDFNIVNRGDASNIPSPICIDQSKLVTRLGVHCFRCLSKDVSASSDNLLSMLFFRAKFAMQYYPPRTKQSFLSLFSYTPNNCAMFVCFTALNVSI